MDFWTYCIVLILRCQNLEISSLGKPFKKLPSICFQQQIWQYMHKVICLTYLQMDLYIYHSHSVKICLPQRYNGEKRFLLSMSKLAKRWNASTISHNLNYDHNRSSTTSYKLQLWDKKVSSWTHHIWDKNCLMNWLWANIQKEHSTKSLKKKILKVIGVICN